jgi:hypothetical protein
MRALALAVLLLSAGALHAQEPAEDVEFDLYAWSRVAAGSPDTKIKFGGGLSVESPLAIGEQETFGRVGLALAIESLPDKGSFSFADLGTWGDYFELSAFLSKQFGTLKVSNGSIHTSAVVFGGATFKSFGQQAPFSVEPRRALRHYAAGVMMEHRRPDGERSFLRVGYGSDDAVGPVKFRQMLTEFSVSLKGPVYLDGRAGLAFGSASHTGEQPDYITVGLRVAVDELIGQKF